MRHVYSACLAFVLVAAVVSGSTLANWAFIETPYVTDSSHAPEGFLFFVLWSTVITLFLLPVVLLVYGLLAAGGSWPAWVRISAGVGLLLAISGVKTYYDGTWWNGGLTLAAGALVPTVIALVRAVDERGWSWLIQTLLVAGSIALSPWIGRGLQLILPTDPPLLVIDSTRTGLPVAKIPPCPSVTGAEAAILATGLVERIEGPVDDDNRRCDQPFLQGRTAAGEPVAFWMAYVYESAGPRWAIAGWTSMGGAHSLETALVANRVTDRTDVRAGLKGPTRLRWEITSGKDGFTYWIDSGLVQEWRPCAEVGDKAVLDSISTTLHWSDCKVEPGTIRSWEGTGPRPVRAWFDGGRLLGSVDLYQGPNAEEAIGAARDAGYHAVTNEHGRPDEPRLIWSEGPVWEFEAWAAPSYRRVLVQYDWASRTVRVVEPTGGR